MRIKLTATIALAAAVAGTAIAHGATVPIAIYSFQTKADVAAFQPLGAGKCTKKWDQMKSMAITVGAKTNTCALQSTVVSDSSDVAADMDVSATVALGTGTPSNLRPKAFVGVAARASETAGYQFRIRPTAQTWQLFRDPKGTPGPVLFRSGKAAFIKTAKPVKTKTLAPAEDPAAKKPAAEKPATEKPAKPTNTANSVSLQVFDNGTTTTNVTAIINGRSVLTFADSATDQPDGRRSGIVTGIKGVKPAPGVVGVFDNVAIRVPSPF